MAVWAEPSALLSLNPSANLAQIGWSVMRSERFLPEAHRLTHLSSSLPPPPRYWSAAVLWSPLKHLLVPEAAPSVGKQESLEPSLPGLWDQGMGKLSLLSSFSAALWYTAEGWLIGFLSWLFHIAGMHCCYLIR